MKELTLERKSQQDSDPIRISGSVVMITPPIDEGYWAYRVRLTDEQAIVGFPKFNTIGIGFAVEEDWNTNLPYRCETEEIWKHIRHNKGDKRITREQGLSAIRLIQDAVSADKGEKWEVLG